jgi:hypothetical protein
VSTPLASTILRQPSHELKPAISRQASRDFASIWRQGSRDFAASVQAHAAMAGVAGPDSSEGLAGSHASHDAQHVECCLPVLPFRVSYVHGMYPYSARLCVQLQSPCGRGH